MEKRESCSFQQNANEQRITELEDHRFADATAIINSGEKYQWILKLMGETWKRNKFYTVSNYLPKKYALVMNGAKATLQRRKLAGLS